MEQDKEGGIKNRNSTKKNAQNSPPSKESKIFMFWESTALIADYTSFMEFAAKNEQFGDENVTGNVKRLLICYCFYQYLLNIFRI